MKKILAILLAIVGFSAVASAQQATCKLGNGKSVVIQITEISKANGTVSFCISNDSPDYVNVSYSFIAVTYTSSGGYVEKTVEDTVLAQPYSSTPKTVQCRRPSEYSENVASTLKVERLTIWGEACEK